MSIGKVQDNWKPFVNPLNMLFVITLSILGRLLFCCYPTLEFFCFDTDLCSDWLLEICFENDSPRFGEEESITTTTSVGQPNLWENMQE